LRGRFGNERVEASGRVPLPSWLSSAFASNRSTVFFRRAGFGALFRCGACPLFQQWEHHERAKQSGIHQLITAHLSFDFMEARR
jgi:hypothetical protein